jgi:hypothetical protein
MITSRDLLAAVRAAQGIPSNYALSRFLDVREKDLQRWNTGKNTPNDAMLLRLCDLANLDPITVVPAIHAERAGDEAMRSVWERIARRVESAGAVSAAVILSALITATPDAGAMPSQAAQAPNLSNEGGSVYYVKSIARRLRRWFARVIPPTVQAPALCCR